MQHPNSDIVPGLPKTVNRNTSTCINSDTVIKKNNVIKVMTLNANSIVNPTKFVQVKDIIIHENIDICCIVETRINPGDKILIIPNYCIIRCDRPTNAGGTAIIYRSSLKCKVIRETKFDNRKHQTEYRVYSCIM